MVLAPEVSSGVSPRVCSDTSSGICSDTLLTASGKINSENMFSIDTLLSLRDFTYEKTKFVNIKKIRKEIKDHTNKRNFLNICNIRYIAIRGSVSLNDLPFSI